MNKITDSSPNFKHTNCLRSTRAGIFLEYLEEELIAVFVDNELYEFWAKEGWTRENVENAIDDLAAQKIISVSAFQNGKIILGIYEPGDLKTSDGGIE